MTCKCGQHLANKDFEFESYAVIADVNYERFLESEVKVLSSKRRRERLRHIRRSAEYVGSLVRCPGCERLALVLPGREPAVEFYFED